MILANFSNGLALCNPDGICYFQSMYGHSAKLGYFRIDSMPLDAVKRFLQGDHLLIMDATRRQKQLTDALKYGVATWCLVFNRAIGQRDVRVCDWQTREMVKVAHSAIHKPTVQTLRKMIKIYGFKQPAVISRNIFFTCIKGATWDDKPNRIKKILEAADATNK